jgi:L-Ala-D/L-Glu epimerase
MKIIKIELFKLNVLLKEPFIIAIQTITNAESIALKITTDMGHIGFGECNPYKSIMSETQDTCWSVGQLLASILRGHNPTNIVGCIAAMDKAIKGNYCIKSAFDMALYDIAAQSAGMPLYQYLGGANNRVVQTDMTVGINTPPYMAAAALRFKNAGFPAIKVKLGTNKADDVARIRAIREAIGYDIPLLIDANQGWNEATAIATLQALASFDIEHCEQPVAARNIEAMQRVKAQSPIAIMADESVFDHFDAMNLIKNNACDYFNIKLAKSGGLHNALKINALAEAAGLKCQVGCFSETRLAMTVLMHFIMACPNVVHFDLDAPLMLSEDPILRGCIYGENGTVTLTDDIGLGAAFDETYLAGCEHISI